MLVRYYYLLLCLFLFCAPLITAREYSVDEISQLAGENADAIKLKAIEMAKAGYSLEEARTRALPDVDLKASFTLMSDPPEGITIQKGSMSYAPSPQSQLPVAFPPEDIVLVDDTLPTYFKITATLTQPLFTWNKITNSIEISRLDYDISRLNLDKAQAETRRDVTRIYYSVVLAEQTLDILEESRGILAEIVADREKSFDEGIINLQKVLESKKNLAGIEKTLVQTEEARESGLAGLAFYAGIDTEELKLVSAFTSVLPALDEEALKSAALTHSHDLNILRQKGRQADRYLEIEKASAPLKPDVSLIASLDVTGQKIPFIGANWTDTWNHNLTLTLGTQVKLFDSGEAKAKINAARATAEMAALGLSQAEKGLELSVRKTIQDVKTNYYTVLEKEANESNAAETYKNARVSFESELVTREEERGAAVLLASAKMELLLARYNYQGALIDLEYLCGKLPE